MDGYDNDGMGGWMWLWGTALAVGALVVIAVLVWTVVAAGAHRRAPEPVASVTATPAARRILDERYARGELDTKEYRERIQTLGG